MLNERQERLVRHLQAHRGGFLKLREIVTDLSDDYQMGQMCRAQEFNNSGARRLLTADIRAINDDNDSDLIIISGARGVKLADAGEIATYLDSEKRATLKKLTLIYKKQRKCNRDGQLRMTAGGELEAIEPFRDYDYKEHRKARGIKADVVVSYIKETVEPKFDAPLLSKIENGICRPSPEVELILKAIYTKENKDD